MEETGYTEPMDIEVRYYYLADELVFSHCEMEEIYRHYNRKVEELNQLILATTGCSEKSIRNTSSPRGCDRRTNSPSAQGKR